MEELNARAKQVFDLMKKYSLQNNIKTMGSEFLILAMYETEDSLCHFLLDEYDVTREEIEEKTKNVFILRKDLGEFNASLEVILLQAKLLAGNHLISEEHLFMAVLMNKNTIACSILEALEFNIDELKKYPNANATPLKQALADYYNVDIKNVFVGNGSDDVIAIVFQALFNSDLPVVYPDLTYSFYPVW